MFGRRDGELGPGTRIADLSARRARPDGGAERAANGDGSSAVPDPPAVGADELCEVLRPRLTAAIDPAARAEMSRGELARLIGEKLADYCREAGIRLNPLEQRDVVTALLNDLLAELAQVTATPDLSGDPERSHADRTGNGRADTDAGGASSTVEMALKRLQPLVMDRIDVATAITLPRPDLEAQISELIADLLAEQKLQLNLKEQRQLVVMMLDDMLGLGPLEPLLGDETVTDIMVNGPSQTYVERRGKLELTGVHFRNNAHVMNIATRIVTRIGRRVDESSPLCDARLQDGSRVNIIIPPLAIDGPSISIRKFSKKSITLDIMAKQENISEPMAALLKIAARCRLNILISGGTGSGKTTLLNALSRMVDTGERVVTIEDAAELQLQQPHVVRLETRPPNLEGDGEVTMRDLVKNALRMRPDRIILGEIRGSEALDMLQAMNTGHDGSMCTIHANRPREAMTRLENMVGMAGINLPSKAVRTQISSAVNMILQISRMRDGIRRVTSIMELVGMEGDIITTQELFSFKYEGETETGRLQGAFVSSGIRPHFLPTAEYFGLGKALLETI